MAKLFAIEVVRYGKSFKAQPIYKMGRGRSVRGPASACSGVDLGQVLEELWSKLTARGEIRG